VVTIVSYIIFDGQDNLTKKIGSGIGQFKDPCGVIFDCNDHLSYLLTLIQPVMSEIVNLPNNVLVGEKVEFTITKYHNGHQCSRGGSQVSRIQ